MVASRPNISLASKSIKTPIRKEAEALYLGHIGTIVSQFFCQEILSGPIWTKFFSNISLLVQEPNSGNCLDLIFVAPLVRKLSFVSDKNHINHISNQNVHVGHAKSW